MRVVYPLLLLALLVPDVAAAQPHDQPPIERCNHHALADWLRGPDVARMSGTREHNFDAVEYAVIVDKVEGDTIEVTPLDRDGAPMELANDADGLHRAWHRVRIEVGRRRAATIKVGTRWWVTIIADIRHNRPLDDPTVGETATVEPIPLAHRRFAKDHSDGSRTPPTVEDAGDVALLLAARVVERPGAVSGRHRIRLESMIPDRDLTARSVTVALPAGANAPEFGTICDLTVALQPDGSWPDADAVLEVPEAASVRAGRVWIPPADHLAVDRFLQALQAGDADAMRDACTDDEAAETVLAAAGELGLFDADDDSVRIGGYWIVDDRWYGSSARPMLAPVDRSPMVMRRARGPGAPAQPSATMWFRVRVLPPTGDEPLTLIVTLPADDATPRVSSLRRDRR